MSQQPSFWARRKAAIAKQAEAEAQAAVALEEAERAEALEEKDDAELLEELGLPDPSEMQQGDDFSAFMSRDVPERLRKVALRTLWRSNPVLANIDGLNEYDDDYRAAMLAQGPIKTAYQVGKGMMAHVKEMERQAAEAEELAQRAPAEEPEEELEAVEEVAAVETNDEVELTSEKAAEVDVAAAEDQPEDAAIVPRKMRFHFEGATG